jgi:hypothetical protein
VKGTVTTAPKRCQPDHFDITKSNPHHDLMRTTLNLDDDIFELVTRQAQLRRTSLGRTVSDLVRKGLVAPTPGREIDGLTVFALPADSPVVTTEDVRRIEADGV